MNGGVDHSLLRCRGCETVFYETSSWDSETIDYWYDENGDTQGNPIEQKITYPKPDGKTKPVWSGALHKVDAQLKDILDEVYSAYDAKLHVLTAVGLRTVFDRATEVLGIDPAITFEEKLDALIEAGWVGSTERETLEVVIDAGNAAAHRGWSPDAAEIAQLLSAMELFLQKALIVGKKALSIKAALPAKPKRQQPRSKPAKPLAT